MKSSAQVCLIVFRWTLVQIQTEAKENKRNLQKHPGLTVCNKKKKLSCGLTEPNREHHIFHSVLSSDTPGSAPCENHLKTVLMKMMCSRWRRSSSWISVGCWRQSQRVYPSSAQLVFPYTGNCSDCWGVPHSCFSENTSPSTASSLSELMCFLRLQVFISTKSTLFKPICLDQLVSAHISQAGNKNNTLVMFYKYFF